MNYSVLTSSQGDFKEIVIPLYSRRVGNGSQTGNCQNIRDGAHIGLSTEMRRNDILLKGFEVAEDEDEKLEFE